jgi:type I restriction enzyme S subunit
MKFRKETEFQETEIGKIPREWKTVKLSSIARIIMGQSPPSDTYNREGLGMPFLQGKMEFGRMYPSPTTYTTQPLKIAEPNDILISVRAPVGDVNIAPYKVCIGRGLAAIRFNLKTANHMFYFYYFQYIKKQLETLGKGSTFKAITKKDLEELLIPLPPIKEQEKVSGILTMIDKTIELYHEERERLDRLKRGLMGELLTGRIRVREENGRLSFYRETELQETEIGKIPKEWGLAKLEKIAKIITGPFGSQLKKSELTNHGIKVYTQENVLERNFEIGNLYISEEKFKELKNFEVMPDDVLLTIRGTIGKSIKVPTSITKGIIHTNLAIIRLEKKEVLPDFVELVFNESEIWMEQVRRMYSATTIPALYGRTLKQIKIMLPPLNEQKAITHIFSTVNRAIELYREEMTRLERLKRGLMDLLLTGKVRVVDGDVGS